MHTACGFWDAKAISKNDGVLQLTDREAIGHFGRITSLKDLPNNTVLIDMISQAAANRLAEMPKSKKVAKTIGEKIERGR
ncbi:MAG: hypothetical protein HQ472_01295 [Ignavibacteria bacterium]|nr:hypothetical protein [Ignavibacteria bacterium]